MGEKNLIQKTLESRQGSTWRIAFLVVLQQQREILLRLFHFNHWQNIDFLLLYLLQCSMSECWSERQS
jgi:hypothetical protein